MKQLFKKNHTKDAIRLIPVHKVDANFHKVWDAITQCTGAYKTSGQCLGEGVVITDPKSLYIPNRVGKATRIKLKRRADAEAEVTGYNAKSLKVTMLNNDMNFIIGIGLTTVLPGKPPGRSK